jgi:hypothetical protein
MATRVSYDTALVDSIELPGGVRWFAGDGAPIDGTSGTGAGEAGPASLYTDRTNKKLYINTNTLASPTWTVVGTQS